MMKLKINGKEESELENGFDHPFFSNIDGKLDDDFFKQFEDLVVDTSTPSELKEKMDLIKESQNVTEALKPGMNSPTDIVKNSFDHFQAMSGDMTPMKVFQALSEKVDEVAIQKIASIVENLF